MARDSYMIKPGLLNIMAQVCEPNLICIIQVSKRKVQLTKEGVYDVRKTA